LHLLRKNEIKPSLAMWTFFSLAVGMSLLTFLKDGNFSYLDNILNTTDLIMVVSVALGIYFMGDKSARFNKFEKLLLAIVGVIIIFWIITQNHFVSNILIQAILVIAYIPVVSRMSKARENTEPFSVWFLLLLAPIISLISMKGDLAAYYTWRAIFCTSALLILMFRIELKKKKIRQKIRG
ncbi:MAG: hypothetical protein ACP5E3_00215, partial [Bacteroidales bacterium]